MIGHDVLHESVTLGPGTKAKLFRQWRIAPKIDFVHDDILDDGMLQSHFNLWIGLWWELAHLEKIVFNSVDVVVVATILGENLSLTKY